MYSDLMNEVFAVGYKQGFQEGRREGPADLLLIQLRGRFDPLSAEREARVRVAPAAQSDAWGNSTLDAAEIDDLVKNGSMS